VGEATWQIVFGQWMRPLIQGLMGAGTHRLLRNAHAVRALSKAATPLRIEELASALAYWAAYYQTLPGVPQLRGPLDLDQAIEQVPKIDRKQGNEARRDSVPRDFVRALANYPAFSEAVNRFGVRETVDVSLSRLVEAGT